MAEMRILIVEDEILIAEDLRMNVQRMGHEVVGVAAQGSEAVQKAIATHPDVVLMDVRLQGPMDGIEAARRIRSHSDIPIIYVTAHASVLASLEKDHRSTRLGKPFSPAQLEAAINSIIAAGNSSQL